MKIAVCKNLKKTIIYVEFMVISWCRGNASRNETNQILTVYLVNGSALYTGDMDQDDL